MHSNHFNVIRMFLRRSNTFGDSSNLHKTISKSLSQQQFDLLKKSPKEVVVTVSNLSLRQVEYKSINNCTYHDFCDWMWLSANMIPFMSLVTKNNMSYADGGICNNIPIQVAIDKGATEIDVIVLSPEHQTINTKPNKNVFSLTFDIFDLIMAQLNASKIEYALHQTICTKKEVQIRCYYTPRVLTETPLVFDAEEMSKWWHEGFKYAQHCLNQ